MVSWMSVCNAPIARRRMLFSRRPHAPNKYNAPYKCTHTCTLPGTIPGNNKENTYHRWTNSTTNGTSTYSKCITGAIKRNLEVEDRRRLAPWRRREAQPDPTWRKRGQLANNSKPLSCFFFFHVHCTEGGDRDLSSFLSSAPFTIMSVYPAIFSSSSPLPQLLENFAALSIIMYVYIITEDYKI
jgi:hypothetical protein